MYSLSQEGMCAFKLGGGGGGGGWSIGKEEMKMNIGTAILSPILPMRKLKDKELKQFED